MVQVLGYEPTFASSVLYELPACALPLGGVLGAGVGSTRGHRQGRGREDGAR